MKRLRKEENGQPAENESTTSLMRMRTLHVSVNHAHALFVFSALSEVQRQNKGQNIRKQTTN